MTGKIGMIIDIVGFFCGLYVAYRAGKYIGREDSAKAKTRLIGKLKTYIKNWLMQRTLQQRAREAADRIRCDECSEQHTCTPLMAKACLKGFIRGYVAANTKN